MRSTQQTAPSSSSGPILLQALGFLICLTAAWWILMLLGYHDAPVLDVLNTPHGDLEMILSMLGWALSLVTAALAVVVLALMFWHKRQ